MTALDLHGKTAIVTGASRGIGLAATQALATAGANVVLTSRKQVSADAAAAQISGSAIGVAAHAVDEGPADPSLALRRWVVESGVAADQWQ
jgi:NAD(P)-dependent dehydrogenase (short-subunit alcohol dehydrogenase family)